MTISRPSAERFDVSDCALEPKPLNVEERRLGIVRSGEVRVHSVELEIRARQQLRQRALQIVVPEPEPVHPRIDLQVIPETLLAARRSGLHGARGAWRRNGRSETTVEESIQVADAERAEHEDIGADAGG